MLRQWLMTDNNLDDNEKTIILNCERLGTTSVIDAGLPQKKRDVLRRILARHSRPLPAKPSYLAQGIHEALTRASVPIDTWWLILGTLEAAVFGSFALPITIAVLALSVGWYIYRAYCAEKKALDHTKEFTDFFQTAEVKYELLKDLIGKEQKAVHQLKYQLSPGKSLKPFTALKDKLDYSKTPKKPASIKKSIGIALGTAAIFALSIFAVSSLFQMLGYFTFIALFANPPLAIGIAIGMLVATVALSIFIGIKHYRENNTLVMLNENKENINQKLDQLKQTLSNLVTKRKELKKRIELKQQINQTKEECQLHIANAVSLYTKTPKPTPSFLFSPKKPAKIPAEIINRHSAHKMPQNNY